MLVNDLEKPAERGCKRMSRFLTPSDAAGSAVGGQVRHLGERADTALQPLQQGQGVVQVEQQKYVCKCGGCVETAPGPERAAPGSRYSLTLAIKVVLEP